MTSAEVPSKAAAAPGPLLGSGLTADVYALDEQWVLRRYRGGLDAADEAAAMRHLHAHGYPVPGVRSAAGPDLVMRRLTGPTLGAAALAGAVTPAEVGTRLGDLLHALHEVPPRGAGGSADRTLHLDLHPENVVLTDEGPMVIDWTNATEGPPALDWAMSALILAQAALAGHQPRELVERVTAALLAHPDRPAECLSPAWLDRACRRRAADPTLAAADQALLPAATELVLRLAAEGP